MSEELKLTSRDFLEGDFIPVRNSGRGEDISPCLLLNGLTPDARSIAITLDDASHPSRAADSGRGDYGFL